MNKQVLLFSCLILLLIPSLVSAQLVAQTNTSVSLFGFHYAKNTNQLSDALTANITVRAANGTLLVNAAPMTRLAVGQYEYNYTFPQNGFYYYYAELIESSNNNTEADVVETVTNINSIAQDTTTMVQQIFQTFLIFLVPFLLAVLAQYTLNELLFLFSGVWFIGSAADMALTGVSWATWSFFTLLGLFFIYHGVSIILEKNERNKKAKEENELYESSTLND